MKQETVNHFYSKLNNLSWYQTLAALSLVITLSAAVYYFVNGWAMQPSATANNSIPIGYGRLVWHVGRLFIVVQLGQLLLLALGSRLAASHEKAATAKATRNAYLVLTVTIFAVVASFFWGELVPFYTIDLAVTGFALAEMVKFVSQLFYARR
ncbi:MAG: hypothetical protein H6660_07865 [Ardenticatenaceae bacterium]|nr:hypothetical protein [Ardenticatenaceae bacterium]